MILDYPGRTSVVIRVLGSQGRREVEELESDVTTRAVSG